MIITNWPGIDKVPAPFLKALISGAKKRGWDANALLGHISSESNFDPSIKNSQPGQSATGLIQVINTTAKALGFSSAAEVGKMGFLEQLEKVVFPYFEMVGGGKQLNGADFKLLGFSGNPALIGAPDSKVLYSDPKVVSLNKFADMDKDGVLTVGDVRSFWRAFANRFGELDISELLEESGSEPVEPVQGQKKK